VSSNQLSVETGSASLKQLDESTELLRKPLPLTNPELSKPKEKEMLRHLAKVRIVYLKILHCDCSIMLIVISFENLNNTAGR
jgi:hypothetical protein